MARLHDFRALFGQDDRAPRALLRPDTPSVLPGHGTTSRGRVVETLVLVHWNSLSCSSDRLTEGNSAQIPQELSDFGCLPGRAAASCGLRLRSTCCNEARRQGRCISGAPRKWCAIGRTFLPHGIRRLCCRGRWRRWPCLLRSGTHKLR